MKGYGQFCPVAKAMEIFGERWTALIIRELVCGSARFNDLRRGNPLISPTLLSQRLKSLESAGVIERHVSGEPGEGIEYRLTEAGRELGPIIMQLGVWGQRWTRSQLTAEDYDPALLMWDVRRKIDASQFPAGRTVVRFEFIDAPNKTRFWWLVVDSGEVDLCMKPPGYEIDLEIRTRVGTMVEIWMGRTTVQSQTAAGAFQVRGTSPLRKSIHRWLGYNDFAHVE
ncbi:MAG: helix-turn-helix domain-containing protein [Ectothiorhodospiraceae bacterium]|jgi:DNA-binding HxlR family transcriptional regulator